MAYKEINLERMPKAFESIKNRFDIPNIIHIVGTNGKGSTGRFIAEILRANGFKVGHYSSPHIFNINERFWRDGENVSDEVLDKAHKTLQRILPKRYSDELSYFEYTTLMTLPIYNHYHWLILEAGLGGEFDATNVFPKKLSIFTPIGFDHQNFLGNTIQEIASTKFRSIGKIAVVAKQRFSEVYQILDVIAKERGSRLYYVNPKEGSSFVEENFATAIKALQLIGAMNIDFQPSDFKLPAGRIEKISENVIVDVGHNLLSAERVLEFVKGDKFILLYNSFEDKPYREILKLFKPYIKMVEIVPIDDERVVKRDVLEATLQDLEIPYRDFIKTNNRDRYLVFGSFRVVEKFLLENS